MEQNHGDTPPNPNPRKPRLIVRLGIFLVHHSSIVSVLCCTLSFLALFLLPILAKNTYVSENALMPGSANPMFSGRDLVEANRLVKDIIGRKFTPAETGLEIPRLIAQHMAETGAEVYFHEFHYQINQFHPLNFFSGTRNSGTMHGNSSCTLPGVNSVGIIRAPRGDGKEAIVLVSPYNPGKIELSQALSLGLAYSIFSLLSRVDWLAKDIVWLAADSRYGEYASVDAWLRDYHSPVFFSTSGKIDVGMCLESNVLREWQDDWIEKRTSKVFRRAGTMAAALVLKISDRQEETEKDTLSIYAEASNGQMPNLDLINIVHNLAVHRQGLRVKVETIGCLLKSAWVKIVGESLEWISKMVGSLNPQWKFAIPVADYLEGTATLASSMYHQALGVPTGSHGAFRDYQVDAITLEISPKVSLNSGHSEFILKGGRLIEGVIRSVNNLLEKFHQSFFLYFLTSPSRFVSVGVYMIAFVLLVTPLPILSAALYSGNHESNSNHTDEPGSAARSWLWLHAANLVFVGHLWAVIVSLLPYVINQLSDSNSTSRMLTWVLLSLSFFIALHWVSGLHKSKGNDWAVVKSVTLAAAAIGLGLMSIVNFATAQIGAALLVPMCLIIRPLKQMGRAGRFSGPMIAACNVALCVIGFPPAAFLITKGLLEGFSGAHVGDFWDWAESLWVWNSATYLYLVLVHLPCWVLCLQIFLHR